MLGYPSLRLARMPHTHLMINLQLFNLFFSKQNVFSDNPIVFLKYQLLSGSFFVLGGGIKSAGFGFRNQFNNVTHG
jgi:hypothetical protein